ncbi:MULTISPECIES: PP2C family serine/threonine-protein phosphatase [unclassified Bradyrhizobium]|uniref:PP2C family protein-serine/threonine phosphatase n=1 Tax=unclassified Bradyrhizobium TaxID=2631580 RepID=UPI0009ECB9C4|nr:MULTISPECIES: PP2C family serine/threonine-protein phosphatase [unclassified Bradyrhizobium]
MTINSYCFSVVGKKIENEDAMLSRGAQDGTWLAAIADGMGGQAGGRVASTIAVEAVDRAVDKIPRPSISEIFAEAKHQLQRRSEERPELSRMGTTLTLVVIEGTHASVGHVGDTRIYHLRNEGIVARTVDQTEVQELIARGVLSKASARRYSRRNVLLSVLSPASEFQLFQTDFELQEGDRLVLCTDGISSKIFAKELRDLSLECKTAQEFCARLMREVESRDPRDDYSAICIDIL